MFVLVIVSVMLLGGVLVWVVDVVDVKIGFFVKQLDDLWFQDEWCFVEQVVKEQYFMLIRIVVLSGEKVLIVFDSFVV